MESCIDFLSNPTATLAKGIETLIIESDDTIFVKRVVCLSVARAISAAIFPIFLSIELSIKKMPQAVLAIRTCEASDKLDDALKYLIAIIPALFFGLFYPEAVPGFFLKRQSRLDTLSPFGVEEVYGQRMSQPIHFPETKEEVKEIVKKAADDGLQISIVGANFSQGTQTIPKDCLQCVINTKCLDSIDVDRENNRVTVGAGATWEAVHLALDKHCKSPIVKQASNPFSIGGSVAINCHGWAHRYGPISKTVYSMTVIDAKGELRILKRPQEGMPIDQLTDDEKLFKCMVGTLGYFGVIVEVTLDIVDNEEVIETVEEVGIDQFSARYESSVKTDQQTILFGGRLSLDTLKGNPLQSVCMVSYKKQLEKELESSTITMEPKVGTRWERISLRLTSILPQWLARRAVSHFWEGERKSMFSNRRWTTNQALHPPINSFFLLHHSNLHTQWLQEYFIKKEKLADFLTYLGQVTKDNNVRLINATIRPTPKDTLSILPYAEEDRYGVVICFAQKKTKAEIAKTEKWIKEVNEYLTNHDGVFYQAYMPYATQEQFQTCYGKDRIEKMQELKKYFDPKGVFGSAHTQKYYDQVKR